ncbi:MAG TPA: hypothetical protein VN709_12580 [Terriglobales bacterium]|nr:hypothetical protein [Terriglobales bacterium]
MPNQDYIFGEVAKSQAARGYYSDAVATAGLEKFLPEYDFLELVSIRAQNGDIAGAKEMISKGKSEWRPQAETDIALVQANAGDLKGALETSRDSKYRSQILDAYAGYQYGKNDFDGSLATIGQMPVGRDDPLLWSIAYELAKRGEKSRAHGILKRLAARGFPVHLSPSVNDDPCTQGFNDAQAGKFEKAHAELERSHCGCETIAAASEAAQDLVGVETELRSCPNPSDASAGFADLAKVAAQRGNIREALRFAADTEVPLAYDPLGYRAPVMRDIAAAWYKQAGAATVLAWARSLPTGYERVMALLGLVDKLTPRPDYSPAG